MAPFYDTNCGRHWTTPKETKLFVLGLEQNMPTELKKQKTTQVESQCSPAAISRWGLG